MTQQATYFCPMPMPTCYRFVVDLSFMLWTCYGEVANLLQTCHEETGVMDFGLNNAHIFHSYPCIIIIITQRSCDMIKNTHFLCQLVSSVVSVSQHSTIISEQLDYKISAWMHHLCGATFCPNWRTATLVDRVLNLALSHGFLSVPTRNRHLCKLLFKGN